MNTTIQAHFIKDHFCFTDGTLSQNFRTTLMKIRALVKMLAHYWRIDFSFTIFDVSQTRKAFGFLLKCLVHSFLIKKIIWNEKIKILFNDFCLREMKEFIEIVSQINHKVIHNHHCEKYCSQMIENFGTSGKCMQIDLECKTFVCMFRIFFGLGANCRIFCHRKCISWYHFR